MLQAAHDNEDGRAIGGFYMSGAAVNLPSFIAQGIAFVILAATLALMWFMARMVAKRPKSN